MPNAKMNHGQQEVNFVINFFKSAQLLRIKRSKKRRKLLSELSRLVRHNYIGS